MPRRLFKRYMPTPASLRDRPWLRPFAALFSDPALWALTRRSSAKGFGAGIFCAFLPIPFQTLVAVAIALHMRINLPVAILAVFISNPVTMGPMLWGGYMVGAWILGTPAKPAGFEFTFEWVWQEIGRIWAPMLLGSVLLGLACALLSYLAIDMLWRWAAVRHFRKRRRKRLLRLISLRRQKQEARRKSRTSTNE
jgi:uncharacterized protein